MWESASGLSLCAGLDLGIRSSSVIGTTVVVSSSPGLTSSPSESSPGTSLDIASAMTTGGGWSIGYDGKLPRAVSLSLCLLDESGAQSAQEACRNSVFDKYSLVIMHFRTSRSRYPCILVPNGTRVPLTLLLVGRRGTNPLQISTARSAI